MTYFSQYTGRRRSVTDISICYFGKYDNDTRNQVIKEALRKNSIKYIECNDRTSSRKIRWPNLIKKFIRIKDQIDIIFVGKVGHFDIPLAWLLGKLFHKPVVFDVFVSLYDSQVLDRKLHSPNSREAKRLVKYDKWSCLLSDLVIVDTIQHKKYFQQEFNLQRAKFEVLPVGAQDIFLPRPFLKKCGHTFKVLFYGTYIPLHGVQYILQAAKLLESDDTIKFELIGNGQTYNEMINLAKKLNLTNVNFIDPLPIGNLIEKIAKADICLGIFGNTNKARRVIPNKVYQCAAMRKPIITGDSPAVREVFGDGKNILLCKMADSCGLGEKITILMNSPILSKTIADNGYRLFQEKFTTRKIGERLVAIFMGLT